jgi:hypothetical protein
MIKLFSLLFFLSINSWSQSITDLTLLVDFKESNAPQLGGGITVLEAYRQSGFILEVKLVTKPQDTEYVYLSVKTNEMNDLFEEVLIEYDIKLNEHKNFEGRFLVKRERRLAIELPLAQIKYSDFVNAKQIKAKVSVNNYVVGGGALVFSKTYQVRTPQNPSIQRDDEPTNTRPRQKAPNSNSLETVYDKEILIQAKRSAERFFKLHNLLNHNQLYEEIKNDLLESARDKGKKEFLDDLRRFDTSRKESELTNTYSYLNEIGLLVNELQSIQKVISESFQVFSGYTSREKFIYGFIDWDQMTIEQVSIARDKFKQQLQIEFNDKIDLKVDQVKGQLISDLRSEYESSYQSEKMSRTKARLIINGFDNWSNSLSQVKLNIHIENTGLLGANSGSQLILYNESWQEIVRFSINEYIEARGKKDIQIKVSNLELWAYKLGVQKFHLKLIDVNHNEDTQEVRIDYSKSEFLQSLNSKPSLLKDVNSYKAILLNSLSEEWDIAQWKILSDFYSIDPRDTKAALLTKLVSLTRENELLRQFVSSTFLQEASVTSSNEKWKSTLISVKRNMRWIHFFDKGKANLFNEYFKEITGEDIQAALNR